MKTEDLIHKLERMFDAHNKKWGDEEDYWGEFLKKWKIKYFCDYDAHVAWQSFDPRKHILIRPIIEVNGFENVYLLVPRRFAEKVLILGYLPFG